MAKLTPQQIAGVAKAAGFPDSELATAVAVALAESGGNPEAVNTANRNGSVDHGLFQINTVHGPLLSQGNKYNALDNARMAFTVWKRSGGSWKPWATYNSGRYLAFKPQGTLGAAAPVLPGAVAGATGGGTAGAPVATAGGPTATAASTSSGVLDLLSGLVSGGLWTRLGAFVLGSVLLMMSLWKLTGAGDIIVQTGKLAAKVGSRGVL